MNENLIAQLDKEIEAAKAQLNALERARSALLGHNGTTPGSRAQGLPEGAESLITALKGKLGKRAPRGFLRAAVLKVLAEGGIPEINIRDLKKKLVAGGYPYSLGDLSKTAGEMVEDGLLAVKPNGPWSTYRKFDGKPKKKAKR